MTKVYAEISLPFSLTGQKQNEKSLSPIYLPATGFSSSTLNYYSTWFMCAYTNPCAIMALATFIKPATLAPFT